MVAYAERRTWHPPTEVQRKFLETLRDVGPQDNAQTAVIRRITKRACRVRGWVEWRRIDGVPDRKAWHLTIAGQKALKPPARRGDASDARPRTSPLALVYRDNANVGEAG
jgi:hypothetical protein